MSSTNSEKRQTPYSAVSDGINETPQTDVFTKEYEVYRQVFELCANASTSSKDIKPDSYISQLLKTNSIPETTETEETMSTKDLKIVINQLGFSTTEAEIGMLMKNSGISGKCSFVDVIKMLKHEDFAESDLSEDRQELRETFNYFDKDCDGFITISDLQDAMECLSLDVKPSELYQMVLGADLDHRVGFEEFETMLKDDDNDS
ncbi:calmodulin-beta-like [Mytilus californianus]|uniref:calmodulin-beta-like n=1 Tax=Mytilus californianus TaxID=6549 RepID=UPI002247870A|nr:calmodulin-beta-like [Mytilus californianus]